jgi:ABC-2 type transport system ATP-binding protein
MAETLPENAVETVDLCKTYVANGRKAPLLALDNVTLAIPRGSVFGLLGPNGAGKSTLINILAGLVKRTSGEARVWGHHIDRDMRAARRAIGVVPQELNVDPFFTPREALDLQAGLYGVPAAERRTDEILAAVNLADQGDAYARSLSGGMRRRLLVAKSMVHSPRVLVLDEPTAGVDVDLRQQLWAYVEELNRKGTTILLTTHYLEEAESLCDTIAIIDQGRLIARDSTAAMLRRLDVKLITVTVATPLDAVPAGLERFEVTMRDAHHLDIRFPPSQIDSGEVIAAVLDAGLVISDLATQEVDLEDIFLRLTGRASGAQNVGAEGAHGTNDGGPAEEKESTSHFGEKNTRTIEGREIP